MEPTDRQVRVVLDATTEALWRDRYFEFCDMASCMPDSPWIAHPSDQVAQVDWLLGRLATHGHGRVTRAEVKRAMDAAFPVRSSSGE